VNENWNPWQDYCHYCLNHEVQQILADDEAHFGWAVHECLGHHKAKPDVRAEALEILDKLDKA